MTDTNPQPRQRGWKQTIRVGFAGLDSFEERRDAMVAALSASRWVRTAWDQGIAHLSDLVDELAATEDGSEYDQVMAAIYDEADADRVWIEVHRG